MGRIPEEVIDRVREYHDIVDVVSQTVQLKKSGRNFFGLCPFHSEKTPSFSVSPDKQIYYCFGCGSGGNVFKFVMELEQLSFVEAVHYLAEQAGIEIPRADGQEYDEEEEQRQQLRQIMELAAQLYHHLLTQTDHGREALSYLRRRGIESRTITTFQLGYAPDSYQFLLPFMKRRGFKETLLRDAGLVATREHPNGRVSYFDRFRHRVMFPIHDSQGRVIAFGGRSLKEGGPKYLNSPETALFHKGKFLFNLHRSRKEMRKNSQAVLFEGYMDLIAAWQAGVEGGVASLGTSLTESQARVIRRNAETAIICYDSDSAGIAAAERGLEVLKQQDCIVKVARMPDGMDPDDYIRKRGGNAFHTEVLAQAQPYTAFKLDSLRREYDLKDEEQRIRYLTQAVTIISELPLAIERDHYLRRLAEEFNISLEVLKQEQRNVASKKKKEANRDKGRGKWNNGYQIGKHMVGQKRRIPAHEEAEKRLLIAMMNDQHVAKKVQETIGPDFNVELHATIAAYLYAYYAEGNPAEPARFIHYVKDHHLIQEISSLIMQDRPEQILEEEIADYMKLIRYYPLNREMENVQKQVEQTERSGDALKAAQMGMEYIQRLREAKKGK
ncbi:DNA primase [Kroppenstedtia pulmonis]|uniref:DNA primase n=1 Tax=Kroppenstedtia pulmonis TaxID=1380685 RepID=A0A7D3XNH0_9BACL|nr:DNA primase [Kroppenstedtia pulmonis]QKG84929.1 DNA primase [Kroppenstedtia pulmonis]